jgi:hypothetical protein
MITTDKKLSIEIIEKLNLQSRSVHKDLDTTKFVFLLSTAPPNILQKKQNDKYILKTRVFSRAARSSRVRLIATCAFERNALDLNFCDRTHTRLQAPCGTAL